MCVWALLYACNVSVSAIMCVLLSVNVIKARIDVDAQHLKRPRASEMELWSPPTSPEAAGVALGSDADALSLTEGSPRCSRDEAVDGDSASDVEVLSRCSRSESTIGETDIDMVLDSPNPRAPASDSCSSMVLPSDPDLEAVARPRRWAPGQNCGHWVVGKLGLGAQAQVLLTSAY